MTGWPSAGVPDDVEQREAAAAGADDQTQVAVELDDTPGHATVVPPHERPHQREPQTCGRTGQSGSLLAYAEFGRRAACQSSCLFSVSMWLSRAINEPFTSFRQANWSTGYAAVLIEGPHQTDQRYSAFSSLPVIPSAATAPLAFRHVVGEQQNSGDVSRAGDPPDASPPPLRCQCRPCQNEAGFISGLVDDAKVVFLDDLRLRALNEYASAIARQFPS